MEDLAGRCGHTDSRGREPSGSTTRLRQYGANQPAGGSVRQLTTHPIKAWWPEQVNPLPRREWAFSQAVTERPSYVGAVAGDSAIRRVSRASVINSGAPNFDAAGREVPVYAPLAIQDITSI